MNKDLLFELGTEEIPARFIDNIKIGMKNFLDKKLEELRISHGDITVKSTPRRFSIFIKDLRENQEDSNETIKGPAKKIAYSEDGSPSKALEGFLRGKGAELSDVFFGEENGTEYIYITKKLPAGKTADFLEEIFGKMVDSLVFDKPMKWGASDIKFIRPIRWLVCLYGEDIMPLNLFGLTATNMTRGHRFLGSDEIKIEKISEYEQKLEENFCILDDEKRKSIIQSQIEKIADELSCNVEKDEQLLDEINYIVEYPTALYGEFEEKYLNLPVETVIVPMKEHQRYFPLTDKNTGKLVNKFLTVRNGDSFKIENVKFGNEKVLAARLADAQFFYDQDSAKKLEEFLPALSGIVYHEKLGTMDMKVQRIEKLAEKIADELKIESKDIKRASQLCKADLTTAMVGEFDELEGIMGGYYAKNSGENDVVATAIREHYLPKHAGDNLPSSREGAIVSLADKMDSLAGFFAVDIKPTGSQDPYGLRRAAIAILNILENPKFQLGTERLISLALDVHAENLEFDRQKAESEISEFLSQRLKNILLDEGYKHDLLDTVFANPSTEIASIKAMLGALKDWANEENKTALKSFTRVLNISKDFKSGEVLENLIEENEEKELYLASSKISNNLKELDKNSNYGNYLEKLNSLAKPISNYFDKVMINAEDEKIKTNRQHQIAWVRDMIMVIGDFNKISL